MRMCSDQRAQVANDLMEEWADRGCLMGQWVHEGLVTSIQEITLQHGKFLRISSAGDFAQFTHIKELDQKCMVHYVRSGRQE